MGCNCYNNQCNVEPRSCPIHPVPVQPFENKPIAMTYTPWQKWTDIYDVDKAFCVGTIFAELNKPFEGGRCR